MVILITGKCCSGKNYVSSLFVKRGYKEIDVDIISKEVFIRREEDIKSLFPEAVIDKRVHRGILASIIFSDSDKRRVLEDILHPEIYKDIFRRISNPGNYIVNIPLLNDMDLVHKSDCVIWVKAGLLTRIFRALKRDNLGLITIFKRIMAQRKLNVKQFTGLTDIYYINNGINSKVTKEVDTWLKMMKI